jgi:hypothetical protein
MIHPLSAAPDEKSGFAAIGAKIHVRKFFDVSIF